MKTLALGNSRDYLALLVRRKWWIILPFVVVFTAVLLITFYLPDIYRSDTLIMVEPKEIPNEFVKDLISVSTEERLKAIQRTILSRTNLLRIISEFEDELDYPEDLGTEERIGRLREAITIYFHEDRKGRSTTVSMFNISYENEKPVLAQKLTQRLGNLFIEYDNLTREEQVFGTTSFFVAELEKVSDELVQAENALKELKERYRYELPEQLSTNLRTLDRLQAKMVANEEALERYISTRLSLERQISETPPVINSEVTENRPAGTLRKAVSPSVIEYRAKERLYAELQSKYTESHPDVVRLKSELERLKQEIPPDEFIEIEEPAPATVELVKPNPVYQNLVNQLRQVNTEIAIREEDQKRSEKEISLYTARVNSTPQREQVLVSAQRRYDELKRQYDSLKSKLNDARLAESLENKQKGTQFVIVDAAYLPVEPAKPDRVKLILIGLAASLAIGLLFGFASDVLIQRVWTQSELEQLVGLPVLIEVPEIVSTAVQRRRFRMRWLQAGILMLIFSLSAMAVYFFLTDPAWQALPAPYLEPVVRAIQRFS